MRKRLKKYSTVEIIVLSIITVFFFIETSDISMLVLAIPKIAQDFYISSEEMRALPLCYISGLIIFLIIARYSADKFGSKLVFLVALGAFILSSFLCFISQGIYQLCFFRGIQGVCVAFLMTTSRIILLKTFAKDRLADVLSIAAFPALLGPAIGPVIGGILIDYSSWRNIFFINLPIGFVLLILSWKILPDYTESSDEKLDFTGFIFFAFGIFFMMIFFEFIEHFSLLYGAFAFGLGGIFIMAFFIRNYYMTHPLMDLSVFKIRSFRLSSLMSMTSRISFGGVIFALSIFFQDTLSFSSSLAGFFICTIAVSMAISRMLVPVLVKTMGLKNLLYISIVMLAVSIYLFTWIFSDTHSWVILIYTAFYGFSLSLFLGVIHLLSFMDIEKKQTSHAVLLSTVIQHLSMGLGVVLVALLIGTCVEPQSPFSANQFKLIFSILSLVMLVTSLYPLCLDRERLRASS